MCDKWDHKSQSYKTNFKCSRRPFILYRCPCGHKIPGSKEAFKEAFCICGIRYSVRDWLKQLGR